MVLYELYCPRCNEAHDPLTSKNVTTKKSIQPGTSLWVKRKETDPKKLKQKAEVETSLWELVPVLSRCADVVTVLLSSGYMVFDLNEHMDSWLSSNEDNVVSDMTELHHAHEPAILHNLKERAFKLNPYTYIGGVLISINPLQSIGSEDVVTGEDLPPSPQAVAERAYQRMIFAGAQLHRLEEMEEEIDSKVKVPSKSSLYDPKSSFVKQYGMTNQSVVITGESGSGKTEAAKRVLKQLVEREGYGEQFYQQDDDIHNFDFQDALMGTNPLLEAFGNATTVRNPNSSRFGKFLQLRYEPDFENESDGGVDYFLYGASITTYLLERSRVTYQEQTERNYKVFYALLTSSNRKLVYGLGFVQAAYKFNYLKSGFSRDDHDTDGYFALRTSFQMSKLQARPSEVLAIVAAILHLGNVKFDEENTKEGSVAKLAAAIVNTFKLPLSERDKQNSGPGTRMFRSDGPMTRGARESPTHSKLRQGNNARTDSAPLLQTAHARKGLKTRKGHGKAGRNESMLSEAQSNTRATRTSKRYNAAIEDNGVHHYQALEFVAELLKVGFEELENILMTTKITIDGKTLSKRVSAADAERRRDALAKHLYALLFDWIVWKLNETLEGEAEESTLLHTTFIGILDIFGFESFVNSKGESINGFSTMLFNYANDSLILSFQQQVLKGESELYKAEELFTFSGEFDGVDKLGEKFQACIDLFNGKKGQLGLFSMIDSSMKAPGATDLTLLALMQREFKNSSVFIEVHPKKRSHYFMVKHYADEVEYCIDNFLVMNDQSLPSEVEGLLKSSKHPVISQFHKIPDSRAVEANRNKRKQQMLKTKHMKNGGKVAPVDDPEGFGAAAPLAPVPAKRKPNAQVTVCGSFSQQMTELNETLLSTGSNYIRCIKPNETLYFNPEAFRMQKAADLDAKRPTVDSRAEKATNITAEKVNQQQRLQLEGRANLAAKKMKGRKYFDDDYVSMQLKNLGIYECVNVLKAGLPTRIPYPSFVTSYSAVFQLDSIVFYKEYDDDYRRKMFVNALMYVFQVDRNSYKLGKTKIFFRSGELEHVKEILANGVAITQTPSGGKRVLGMINKFFHVKRWKAYYRKWQVRKFFFQLLDKIRAIKVIQKHVRKALNNREELERKRLERAAIVFQKNFRRLKPYREYQAKRDANMLMKMGNMIKTFVNKKEKTKPTPEAVQAHPGSSSPPAPDTTDPSVQGSDTVELKSIFTGGNTGSDALRSTMKNYFNRRVQYNMGGNKALSRMMKEEAENKRQSEKTKLSPKPSVYSFTDAKSSQWPTSDMEMKLYIFDGPEGDPSLDPFNDDASKESFQVGSLGSQSGPGFGNFQLEDYDDTSTDADMAVQPESDDEIDIHGDLAKRAASKNKRSVMSTNDTEMPKSRLKTRMSKRGTRQSKFTFSSGTGAPVSPGAAGVNSLALAMVGEDLPVAKVDPAPVGPLVNKLNPKKSKVFFDKRKPSVRRKTPPWQAARNKLKKVNADIFAGGEDTVASTEVLVALPSPNSGKPPQRMPAGGRTPVVHVAKSQSPRAPVTAARRENSEKSADYVNGMRSKFKASNRGSNEHK